MWAILFGLETSPYQLVVLNVTTSIHLGSIWLERKIIFLENNFLISVVWYSNG